MNAGLLSLLGILLAGSAWGQEALPEDPARIQLLDRFRFALSMGLSVFSGYAAAQIWSLPGWGHLRHAAIGFILFLAVPDLLNHGGPAGLLAGAVVAGLAFLIEMIHQDDKRRTGP